MMRGTKLRPLLAALTGALLLLAAPRARGDVKPEDAKEAAALFNTGKKLVEEGKAAEACPKFERSQCLDPGVGTLYNLADCYERIGKTASAWAAFVEVVKLSKESKRADREKLAQERVTAIEPRLSRLAIDVPEVSRVRGLEVRRDGVSVPRTQWGVGVPVDPGIHSVSVAAPERSLWKADVMVNDGATRKIPIALSPPWLTSEPYSTGMMAGGIVASVIGGGAFAATGLFSLLGAFKHFPEPAITTMAGSGALLVTGVVLIGVGAHPVRVDGKARRIKASLVFGPLSGEIKVSF